MEKFTYINIPKIKNTIIGLASASLVLFTGSKIGNGKEIKEYKEEKKEGMSICHIDVLNYDHCDNSEEFLSFTNKYGEVLQTCKINGKDLIIYMPNETSEIASATMRKNIEVPKFDSNDVEYTIYVDYKYENIGVRAKDNNYQKNKEKSKWLLEENSSSIEEDTSNNIKSIKSKYNNINYDEITNDGFKVQGVTKINDTVLITCYDQNKDEYKRNSRIYLYDSVTGVSRGHIILNTSSHVGGISFDNNKGILYISSCNGSTITFDLNKENLYLIDHMLNKDTVIDLSDKDIDKKYNMTIDNDITVSDITNCGRNSTMFSSGDYVYVATFNSSIEGVGEVVKFKIDEIKDGYYVNNGKVDEWVNKELKSSVVYTHIIPDFTQGVLKTTYDGNDYLITSQSYSNAKSIITIFLENDKKLEYVGSKVINHPGIESLHIDDNNKIICVFENGNCDIYETTIEKLLSDLDKKEVVEEAILEQERYGDIDRVYNKILEDRKYYDYSNIDFVDVIDSIRDYGGMSFISGTFKEIPNACREFININGDYIDIVVSSSKVIPREIKVRVLK